ncbi:MAG: carboxypeptidase regulatory-like domain-containing protein [Bacteroidota bacterium]
MLRLSSLLALVALAALVLAPGARAQTGTAQVFLSPADFAGPSTGAPALDGLAVDFYEIGTQTLAFSGVVGADSTATVQNAPVGTYVALLAPNTSWTNALPLGPVSVSPDGGSPGFLLVSPVTDDDGLVSGQITDGDTGDPVPFLIGVASSECDFSEAFCTGAFQIFTTDASGTYGFPADPGEATVSLFFLPDFLGLGFSSSLLYEPVERAVSVTAGATTTLNIALDARGTGFLSGIVTDPSGAPAAGVPVELGSTDNLYFAQVTTGPDGSYAAELPEADYLVRASGSSIGALDVYYDGAFDPTSATPVTVAEDATVTGIDIALEALPSSLTATVQGIVTDAAGTPLDGITVGMYNWAENFFLPVAEGVSGADGSYEITYSSLALVNAPLLIGVVDENYEWQFYDGKPTFSVADFLRVGVQDTTFTGIDFSLLPIGGDGPGFSISGTVSDGDSGGAIGQALIAAADLEDGSLHYGVSDASGAYRIQGLPEGDYVVLFTKEEYAPEFWPDARSWTRASTVTVSADVQNVNALMGGLNRPVRARGVLEESTLQGTVRDAEGQPLVGALITASVGEEVIEFALTDARGGYALDSLPPSVVDVRVDLPRFEVAEETTTMYGGSGVLSFDLMPRLVVSNEPVRGEDEGVLQVIPNPTRGEASVAFSLPEGADVRVAVYDMLGREVAVVAEGARAEGTHTARLGTEAMAPGLYLVRVETAEGVQSVRFTVVR